MIQRGNAALPHPPATPAEHIEIHSSKAIKSVCKRILKSTCVRLHYCRCCCIYVNRIVQRHSIIGTATTCRVGRYLTRCSAHSSLIHFHQQCCINMCILCINVDADVVNTKIKLNKKAIQRRECIMIQGLIPIVTKTAARYLLPAPLCSVRALNYSSKAQQLYARPGLNYLSVQCARLNTCSDMVNCCGSQQSLFSISMVASRIGLVFGWLWPQHMQMNDGRRPLHVWLSFSALMNVALPLI